MGTERCSHWCRVAGGLLRLLFLATSVGLTSGCVTGRIGTDFPFQNGSLTELNGANFQVERTGLRGEASCGYVLGFIPIGDPSLATRAMDSVVNASDSLGKPVALVNFAGEKVVTNFFYLYVVESLFLRADAVRFTR